MGFRAITAAAKPAGWPEGVPKSRQYGTRSSCVMVSTSCVRWVHIKRSSLHITARAHRKPDRPIEVLRLAVHTQSGASTLYYSVSTLGKENISPPATANAKQEAYI